MIVAYVCDSPSYLPFLKVSMASIRRYNKDVEFAVLTNKPFEIPGAKVYTFKPDSNIFKFREKDRMHEGVYYKFYLPKLPYNKVLYIDCDVICQRPLNSLWKTECPFICGTESHNYGKKQAAQLGLKKYLLTSMMLMNLKALRKANFTKRCLERLKISEVTQHDETIINLEFNDKIKFIDVKYNYCRNRKYEKPIPESDAYLLHYIGNEQKKDMLLLTNFDNLMFLKELVKRKRVAIVGNSEAIFRHQYGEEIDKHDIIIRFNKGFPHRCPESLGTKTDILFLACTLNDEELNYYGPCHTVKRSRFCFNNCHFRIITDDRISLCQRSAQPSTGFIAINFALSTECKSIDLYGFDFFKSATYYNLPGYQTLHNGDAEQEKILEYQKYKLLEVK